MCPRQTISHPPVNPRALVATAPARIDKVPYRPWRWTRDFHACLVSPHFGSPGKRRENDRRGDDRQHPWSISMRAWSCRSRKRVARSVSLCSINKSTSETAGKQSSPAASTEARGGQDGKIADGVEPWRQR